MDDGYRTNLSTVIGSVIAAVTYEDDGYIHFYNSAGDELMQVKYDELFDKEGNRFDIADIPFKIPS